MPKHANMVTYNNAKGCHITYKWCLCDTRLNEVIFLIKVHMCVGWN